MSLVELLSYPPILENLSYYLTFPQAVQLKWVLRMKFWQCPIAIADSDHIITYLPQIDTLTVQIYQLISKSGSLGAMFRGVSNDQLDLVQMLVQLGMPVNSRLHDLDSALVRAAQTNSLKVAEFLIDQNACIEGNKGTSTPLTRASTNDRLEMIQLLLRKKANIDGRNSNGDTALMVAIMNRCLPAVKLLIQEKADITISTPFTGTAIEMAEVYRDHEMLKLLLPDAE